MARNNYIIRLTDNSQISLSPDQIKLYPTIKDQIADLAPGNIVDINYLKPKGLYQLLTNPNEALPFDSFLNMIEAADYVRNDDILNNLLVQMATTFTDKSFKTYTKDVRENMIDLVYKLPETVIYRFLRLMQTVKLDYEISPDRSASRLNPAFNNDLNTSFMVKSIDSYFDTGIIFNKNNLVNVFRTDLPRCDLPPNNFYINKNMDVYSFNNIMPDQVVFNIDYPFLTVEDAQDGVSNTLTRYERSNYYKREIILEFYTTIKVAQGGKRYALISNLEEDEEDQYARYSVVRMTDKQTLAQFELPRNKYEYEYDRGDEILYGTLFPRTSPRMKIVVWQFPKDVKNLRYRITAIDLPQQPTFFIENIDFLAVIPNIFRNWPIGHGYLLFNANEDKILLVKKTVDGHEVSLMTNEGEVRMTYLFTEDIPILLVNDMIITVSYELSGRKNFQKYVVNVNSRLKIWYTRNMTKPISVYDNTFVPDIKGYESPTIGNMYTGIGNSILLSLVYEKIGFAPSRKNVYKKYNIRSYQNMPEFFNKLV